MGLLAPPHGMCKPPGKGTNPWMPAAPQVLWCCQGTHTHTTPVPAPNTTYLRPKVEFLGTAGLLYYCDATEQSQFWSVSI